MLCERGDGGKPAGHPSLANDAVLPSGNSHAALTSPQLVPLLLRHSPRARAASPGSEASGARPDSHVAASSSGVPLQSSSMPLLGTSNARRFTKALQSSQSALAAVKPSPSRSVPEAAHGAAASPAAASPATAPSLAGALPSKAASGAPALAAPASGESNAAASPVSIAGSAPHPTVRVAKIQGRENVANAARVMKYGSSYHAGKRGCGHCWQGRGHSWQVRSPVGRSRAGTSSDATADVTRILPSEGAVTL